MTSLLLPKRFSDLKCVPCSPARDWGSRVSGLVLSWASTSFLALTNPKWLHQSRFYFLVVIDELGSSAQHEVHRIGNDSTISPIPTF